MLSNVKKKVRLKKNGGKIAIKVDGYEIIIWCDFLIDFFGVLLNRTGRLLLRRKPNLMGEQTLLSVKR